jgi:hypothetical protein
MVDQARITHNVDPAHGADNEADPKRQHYEQKKSLFVSAFTAVEKICGYIPHDNAQNDRLKGDANRSNEYFRIKEIFKKFGVIAKLKGRNVGSGGGSQPEAVNDNKADRNNQ